MAAQQMISMVVAYVEGLYSYKVDLSTQRCAIGTCDDPTTTDRVWSRSNLPVVLYTLWDQSNLSRLGNNMRKCESWVRIKSKV